MEGSGGVPVPWSEAYTKSRDDEPDSLAHIIERTKLHAHKIASVAWVATRISEWLLNAAIGGHKPA